MSTGTRSRRVALDALIRIERDGAYANLVLPSMLAALDPPLPERDRRLVTELVYGTTRMRRACDWWIDRFITTDPDPATRALLRLGAYQLAFTAIPPYAAVDATVGMASPRVRRFVNAVLRAGLRADTTWPGDAVRLSYPDWILDELTDVLGPDDAVAALAAMDEPAVTHERADGYVQDPASQAVAAAVEARPGERILDVCAAPGGKATALAAAGAHVVAVDLRPSRAGLVVRARATAGLEPDRVAVLVADGAAPPLRPAAFDRVLVDAPCSGLGSLRRRPDARWRIESDAVVRLADLQRQLLAAAAPLVRPGGVLVYSVCTFTRAETVDIDAHLERQHPSLVALDPPGPPWRRVGRGARLLPQDAGTDGMYLLRLRRADEGGSNDER